MAKKTESTAKKPLKVKVVGTGGIGLSLLPNLCRYLNYSGDKFPSVELSLIDGDHFEERNRERQEFVETGPKASMTAADCRRAFVGMQPRSRQVPPRRSSRSTRATRLPSWADRRAQE